MCVVLFALLYNEFVCDYTFSIFSVIVLPAARFVRPCQHVEASIMIYLSITGEMLVGSGWRLYCPLAGSGRSSGGCGCGGGSSTPNGRVSVRIRIPGRAGDRAACRCFDAQCVFQ